MCKINGFPRHLSLHFQKQNTQGVSLVPWSFFHSFISDYVSGGESPSSYKNNRISTQQPFRTMMPATVLIPGQWYNANIDPLSFWRARLIVEQSSQNYEMNLTFVGTTSEMGIGEKVYMAGSNSVYFEGTSLYLKSNCIWSYLFSSRYSRMLQYMEDEGSPRQLQITTGFISYQKMEASKLFQR